jgi:NAD-specific glutamate dehydrogenase
MLSVMVIFNAIHPSEVKALLRGGKVSRGGLKLYDVSSTK